MLDSTSWQEEEQGKEETDIPMQGKKVCVSSFHKEKEDVSPKHPVKVYFS